MATVRAKEPKALGAPAHARRGACSTPLAACAEFGNPPRSQTDAVPREGVPAAGYAQRFARLVRRTGTSLLEQVFARWRADGLAATWKPAVRLTRGCRHI